MTGAPTLSVVLPSYRRLQRLPPLVGAHLGQGADEVVVVLDGPHDGWRSVLGDLLAEERVKVLELPANRGLALARIAGLEAAGGEVILMADDDVEPEPGTLERHRAFHAQHAGHVLLGSMPVALPAHRPADAAATYLYARDYQAQVAIWRRSGSDLILGSLWGGNVSLPRELYLRAERFKPSQRLDYNEDLDLGLRLREVGAIGVFDESARSLHHHHRDLAGFATECVVRGRAIADLEKRWGRMPAQLVPMVQIPGGYNRLAGAVQRRIGSSDRTTLLERGLVGAYRLSGALRLWKVQDAVTRLLRRGLIIRGYWQASRGSAPPAVSRAASR
jgi:GT2 family glycosyltransferase